MQRKVEIKRKFLCIDLRNRRKVNWREQEREKETKRETKQEREKETKRETKQEREKETK